MNRAFLALMIAAMLLVSAPVVWAHAPLAHGGNYTLATATLIPDPLKSWAIYGTLTDIDTAQYFRLNINQGQVIHISLLRSTDPSCAFFTPSVVLLGPDLNDSGTVPDFVERPVGFSFFALAGHTPAQATYESFAPSSFYQLADLMLKAPATGTYYLAIFDPQSTGNYGLAVGDRESFTLSEWTLNPLNVISVYQWEGQNLLVILLPAALTLGLGGMLLFVIRKGQGGREDHFTGVGHWRGCSSSVPRYPSLIRCCSPFRGLSWMLPL